MFMIRVKGKIVYCALEALDSLLSPGTTNLSDNVKMSRDNNDSLRTAFAE